MSKHKERQFQIEIVQHLTFDNWAESDVGGYSRNLTLYSDDLISYIKSAQLQAYEKMQKRDQISRYKNEKTQKIDIPITKAIDLPKEKRTALISSAVTRKIDVRGEVVS